MVAHGMLRWLLFFFVLVSATSHPSNINICRTFLLGCLEDISLIARVPTDESDGEKWGKCKFWLNVSVVSKIPMTEQALPTKIVILINLRVLALIIFKSSLVDSNLSSGSMESPSW